MTNRRGRQHSKAPVPHGKVATPTMDFSQMRHRYYIVRPEPNKTCVPMIAVDELPKGFQLKGVPMTVTPQQIQEWDMARVGADVELKYTFETNSEPQPARQRGQKLGPENKYSLTLKTPEVPQKAIKESSTTEERASGSATVKTDSSDKSDSHEKLDPVHEKTEKEPHPISELQQQANVCETLVQP